MHIVHREVLLDHWEAPELVSCEGPAVSRHSQQLNSWKYQEFETTSPIVGAEDVSCGARPCGRARLGNLSAWIRNSTSINYQHPRVLSEEPQISSKGASKITSRSSRAFISTVSFAPRIPGQEL